MDMPAMASVGQAMRGLTGTERQVLRVVQSRGGIHRLEIAAICGLQASTLTHVAGALIERGLLTETVERQSGKRGKPRQILSLNPAGAFTAGVALTAERATLCIADLVGTVLWEKSEALPGRAPDAVAEQTKALLNQAIADLSIPMDRFLGVGFTMPGTATRTPPYLVPLPQFAAWRDIVPGEFLAKALGLPIWFENDANGMALAEAQFGDARRLGTVLCLYLAHGIGAGLIIEGELYRGAHGNAGEVGGLYPRMLARPSGDDLLRHLAELQAMAGPARLAARYAKFRAMGHVVEPQAKAA